jgi:hypothetical protein
MCHHLQETQRSITTKATPPIKLPILIQKPGREVHSDLPIGIPDNASVAGIDHVNDGTWNPIDGLKSPTHQIGEVDVTEHAAWMDGLSATVNPTTTKVILNQTVAFPHTTQKMKMMTRSGILQTNSTLKIKLKILCRIHKTPRGDCRKEESAWWPYGSKEVFFFYCVLKTEVKDCTDN